MTFVFLETLINVKQNNNSKKIHVFTDIFKYTPPVKFQIFPSHLKKIVNSSKS